MHTRVAVVAAAALLLFGTGALAQSRHDPEAARIEQAAIALVKLLDDGRYDEAASRMRTDAAQLDPRGAMSVTGTGAAVTGLPGGMPSAAQLQSALDVRRQRGRLANRQTMTVFVEPLQSKIVTGRASETVVRAFAVEFDTSPETPMVDRRRRPAPVYREIVGGYLLPGGELLVTSYGGAAAHASDRVAGTEPSPGTGTTGPEAIAIAQALDVAKLLDQGRGDEVLARIRASIPELYATAAQWEPVAARLRADFVKRAKRGALKDRKVMLASGQGTFEITLGATGTLAPIPQRYGPNPMGSVETMRVQVFGGEIRVLDYRFGF